MLRRWSAVDALEGRVERPQRSEDIRPSPASRVGEPLAPIAARFLLLQGAPTLAHGAYVVLGLIGALLLDERGALSGNVTVPAVAAGTVALMTAEGPGAPGGVNTMVARLVVVPPCQSDGPRYSFTGFFSPIDNRLPAINMMTAGRAVPVKFSLGADHGLDVFASGNPSAVRVDCTSGTTTDAVETTTTAGNSSLSYDRGGRPVHVCWKTDQAWAGTCRRLTLTFRDGTSQSALFNFATT